MDGLQCMCVCVCVLGGGGVTLNQISLYDFDHLTLAFD